MATSQQNESIDLTTSISSSARTLTRWLYLYPVLAMVMMAYVLSEYYAYGSFGRALMFQPNDQPGAPFEIQNTIVSPLLGQHFAGDLFLPYVNVREGVLEAYYGASLLVLNLLKGLEYRWIFVLFILLSVVAVKWSVRLLGDNSSLSGPTTIPFLVTLPFITSLDRGNVHGFIIVVLLAVVATFFASGHQGSSSKVVSLRSKWYDPLIFGAVLSIKVYMAGVLLICLASTFKSRQHRQFLARSTGAFLLFLLSPSILFGEEIFYWTLSGPNAQTYRSDEYFLGTRKYNTSILAILIDREWLTFAASPTVSISAIAILSVVLAISIALRRRSATSLVPHAFLTAVSVALLLPISGGYTTAVFGLPWLVACNEGLRMSQRPTTWSHVAWRRSVPTFANFFLLLLSSLLLVPIFTVVPGSPLPVTVRFVMPFVVLTAAVATLWLAGHVVLRGSRLVVQSLCGLGLVGRGRL